MQVEDLRPGQFALGGVLIGVLSGLLLGSWWFGGVGMIASDLLHIVWAMSVYGMIGGVTAFGSIKIAQRSLPGSGQAQLR